MPQLQVALDFVDLSRAMKAAEAAVAGGADILEVGTPLIKSEGLDAVRRLRERFPHIEILADMKTVDAGRIEVEAAAKAGASIITVLGMASAATVEDCVESGRSYGIKIALDLLSCGDPVELARRAEAMGVYEVCIHSGVDEQMRGGHPFDTLRLVRKAVGIKVSVAGGINSETAAQAVAAGADVVVVGGAIVKAADVEAATAAIKKAITTGRAVKTDLYHRVGEEEAAAAFLKVSTPNICDAMHRSGAFKGLARFSGSGRFAGKAVTVRTYPGDWAKPVEAIDRAEPGDVIVIDAGGQELAVWGELASLSAVNRKVAAVVIDGAIRDIDDVRALGFQAWGRFLNPVALEPKGFGEINVPVQVGGLEVEPGDFIVGDDTGLVRVPRAKAAEIANRAMSCLETENRLREEIRAGSTLSAVAELLRWEKRS